jgi:hypothetical protein
MGVVNWFALNLWKRVVITLDPGASTLWAQGSRFFQLGDSVRIFCEQMTVNYRLGKTTLGHDVVLYNYDRFLSVRRLEQIVLMMGVIT